MTRQLSTLSPRLPAARRFAFYLRTSMKDNRVGQIRLAKLTGCASSAIAMWRMGRNLPRLDTALRLAECLSNDLLASIVREARTGACDHCGAPFLNEGGAPKKYCSEACLTIAAKIRHALAPRTPLKHRFTALKAEVKSTNEQLANHKVSVLEMCRSCEPAGYCRTPSCPLRPISPLLLIDSIRDVPMATPASGLWGAEHREKTLETMRAANKRRWDRPGERDLQSEQMRARHAALTPEQHAAWVSKIKETKGRRVDLAAKRKKAVA